MNITLAEARTILESLWDGTIFSVEFRKRSDGTIRKMTCRYGVQKGTAGLGPKYDPAKHNLAIVWDTVAKDFRSINLDAIISIKMKGVEYHVSE